MTQQEFEVLFNLQLERCKKLLDIKGTEYSNVSDRMRNFIKGSELNTCTPEFYLHCLMTKHLVSISDMVKGLEKGQTPTIERWNEKITDAINYLFLLDALYRRSEQ